MPSIKKIITGKMNSDASNDLMPQEDFRDALNLTVDDGWSCFCERKQEDLKIVI